MAPLFAQPISGSGLGPTDARLLVAGLKARQTEIVGEVIDDSLERMAETRERRAEERAERELEEDRLRSIALRERTDAESAVRAHEQRRAEADRLAAKGDAGAALEADRAGADAAQSRLDAKRADVDLVV